MKSVIRLFRAIPIESHKISGDKDLLKRTIKEGFVFAPEVFGNYSGNELEKLFEEVKSEIGLNGKQANSAFHKSWKKVKDASIEQLFIEQVIHYFTTYGLENVGLLSSDTVYIPSEKLSIPQLKEEKIPLVVIHGYTKAEIKTKLLDFVNSGIALHEDTVEDVIDVAVYVSLTSEEIQKIKNKEVKTALYDYLGLVPGNAVEFLRYIVYKATDSTLLIKNEKTINTIKEKKNLDVTGLFIRYKQAHGLEPLAEIFYRFKPLFLAFRTNPQSRQVINKIRKLAEKHHKPMPEDYLNTITGKIHSGNAIDFERLYRELGRVTVFRKIRLAYALKFRTTDAESILYKIRNGRGYSTEIDIQNKDKAAEVLTIILDSIAEQVAKNVKGKTIYIPENINYALPTTEKQFTGMFPSGTYVSIPKNMIFGVHWENSKDHRIDLDLSLLSADAKYGWDASYRNDEGTILFSGDMTDAPQPNGAAELFYVKRQTNTALLLMINYFNFEKEVEVPFQIFVAREAVSQMRNNYVVNPNNIIAIAQATMNQKQKVAGLLVTTEIESRFYFSEAYLGNAMTSSRSHVSENTRKYFKTFYANTICLNDILAKAGAVMTTDKERADIDLSPTSLNKESIISLIK